MIPYGRQSIDEDDIAAVTEVLRGDWLTQGPHVEEFEQALTEKTGCRHALAFANGTAALHAAALAAGLGPGSTVATSPLSFVASSNCARYVGASPVFVDIDPATLNLDPRRVGPCDALVAVHYAGLPVDLTALGRRPTVVIEDAAHALGAETPDGPVGNCARSDLCVFSFHPVKAITTAEGGAVTTNSHELAGRLRRIRHHGIVPGTDDKAWNYDIPTIGFNYRLSDMQAALGSSQLRKLESFLGQREEQALRYCTALADFPLELPPEAPAGSRHGLHLFPVRVAERDRVFNDLRARGIGVQVHYKPIYRLTAYRDLGFDPAAFPEAERACDRLISLPLFPGLTRDEQERVVKSLEAVL